MQPTDNREDPEAAQPPKEVKEVKEKPLTWDDVDRLAIDLIPHAPPPPALETYEFGRRTTIPRGR